MPSKGQTENCIIHISPPLKDGVEFKLAEPKRTKKTFQILPLFGHLPGPHVLDAKNEMRLGPTRSLGPSRAAAAVILTWAADVCKGLGDRACGRPTPAGDLPALPLCWLLLHPGGLARRVVGAGPASAQADPAVSAQTEAASYSPGLMKVPVFQSHIGSRSQMTYLHFKGPFCGL